MKNSPQEKILISSVRFRELINTLDISYCEFAKNVGTDRGSVSKFVSGKAKPSRGLLNSIILTYHVNPIWLNGGDGPMFTDELDAFRSKLILKMRDLDKEDLELMENFIEYINKLKMKDK